jgi:hypothetical protein
MLYAAGGAKIKKGPLVVESDADTGAEAFFERARPDLDQKPRPDAQGACESGIAVPGGGGDWQVCDLGGRFCGGGLFSSKPMATGCHRTGTDDASRIERTAAASSAGRKGL